jgi:class 3 adenylate cyclase/tetratricopeptide (TPR) repeat protein
MGTAGDDIRSTSDVLERRSYVTLLFSDVCDYTPIIEKLDPEDADEFRASIVEVAHRVVTSHGGQVNQFVGDGLLAVFGFPEPDENAVRRALAAALDFHREVAAMRWDAPALRGFSARIHSGVHSGLVFLRRGNPLAGHYELSGDAVNTAARLCSAAGRDEIIVSDSTLHGLERFFRVLSVPALHLKGKSYPVSASRVLDVAPEDEPAGSRRAHPTFVGREDELATLDALLEDAIRRRGSVVSLMGDAGIGKSRLLSEFTQRARLAHPELRVHRGTCESYGDVVPLRPFLKVLREVFPVPKDAAREQAIWSVERALTQIDEGLREHLTVLLNVLSLKPAEPASADAELVVIDAITDVLLSLGKTQPLLLVFDDWQWADDASVQVLGRLERALPDLPIQIVIGAREVRDDDPVLGAARRLTLRPFSESESIRAVAQLLAPMREQVALKIHQRSGGNPLFLEEICQSLPKAGEFTGELGSGEIPRNVRELISVRLGRLHSRDASVLYVASVLGNEFPTWLLRAVAPELEIDAALEVLVREGFLFNDEHEENLRFRHGIVREVAYDSVRVRERRRLHDEVARVLEKTFAGVALADHYEALASHHAAAGNAALALEFAELSGDKATASSALDRARAQYGAALSQLEQLDSTPELVKRRFRLVSKWAAACVFSPSREQLKVLTRALEIAEQSGDEPALMRIEYAFGWLCYALGDQKSSVMHLTRALRLAQAARDEVSIAQIHSNLGQSHAAVGNYDEALESLDKGIEMKRRRSRSRSRTLPVGFAYALGCRGLVYGDRGEFQAAYVQVQEALDVVRDSGHAVEGSLLCVLGMIQLWQGRWQEALQTAERGRRTGERVNGPYVLAICRVLSGYAEFVERRSDTALAELGRAVTWLEGREIGLYLGFSYSHLAEALLLAERHDEAREFAQRAIACATTSDPLGQASGQRTLSVLAAREGQREQAVDHTARAFESARKRSSERDTALTHLYFAQVQRIFGDHAAARAELTAAKMLFQRLGMAHHEALAQRRLNGELNGSG